MALSFSRAHVMLVLQEYCHPPKEVFLTSFGRVLFDEADISRWRRNETWGYLPLQLLKTANSLLRRDETVLRALERLALLLTLPGLSDHFPAGQVQGFFFRFVVSHLGSVPWLTATIRLPGQVQGCLDLCRCDCGQLWTVPWLTAAVRLPGQVQACPGYDVAAVDSALADCRDQAARTQQRLSPEVTLASHLAQRNACHCLLWPSTSGKSLGLLK